MGLFLVGAFVTALALGGIGILVWGAVLDGRYEREMRARPVAGPAVTES